MKAERHDADAARRGDWVPTLYTANEAAAILRVTKSWLERQAAARRVPFTMLGGGYRFSAGHLAQIVDIFEEGVVPSGTVLPSADTSVSRSNESAKTIGLTNGPLRPRPSRRNSTTA